MLGEFLIFVLFELILPVLAEFPVEVGARSVTAAFGRERDAPAVLAWIGLLLIGAALGGISLGIWRYRLAGAGPFPGVSLIVSPVLNGFVMETYGRWRARHGRPRTHASTFVGGAIFAVGIALVRFAFAGFPPLPLER